MKLVVVESPAKAKTIGKIVGPDYIVKASVGHVRDLPKHSLGIKISPDDAQFEPVYIVTDDKKTVVADLVRKAKECDAIYLASDPDREGEAIAWHLKEILEAGLKKGSETKFFRVQYNEITPTAVRKAFEDPHDINMPLVDAQQARRVLDRLVGYKVSPSLWQQVGKGLSAGRVQSVAVRLIVERERAIEQFVSDIDFRMEGRFNAPNGAGFAAEYHGDLKDQAAVDALAAALSQGGFQVRSLEQKTAPRKPAAPFTTSTLQQEASRKLGMAVSRTMSLAQKLYENGHITYMRTDSVNLSEKALTDAKRTIEQQYGREYVLSEPRTYKSRSNILCLLRSGFP